MKSAYLYFLLCSDETIYTGTTTNLEQRLYQHSIGEGCDYTKTRLPVTCIHVIEFPTLEEAARAEQQIKKWSKRKKLALIKGDFALLHHLARCQNDSVSSKRD